MYLTLIIIIIFLYYVSKKPKEKIKENYDKV